MAKKSKSKVAASGWTLMKLFYLLVVLVVLLSTATYTWFTISRTPKVHAMTLYINSGEGLMISADRMLPFEEWEMHLDYGDHVPENTILKPATWSDSEGKFYASDFDADGRIRGISHALTDERNANGTDSNSYYVKFTFYARSQQDVDVSLADPGEKNGNFVVGMPEWDDEEIIHNNGGQRAQSAIRIGFKITMLDDQGDPVEDEPIKFIIYEPNCDMHVDYTREYQSTASIDGTEGLVPQERLIRQTTTSWIEADPVQYNVVIYNYGEFIDETKLFTLDRHHTAQIDLYMWLEGQDVDCTNEIGKAAKIIAGIQFNAVTRGNSGLDEIE